MLIDFGTGDGRFVLDQARKYPSKFCIGIDAAAENLAYVSRQALQKPARGGVLNALFVWASVEDLPLELNGIADELTINYPWGSLLRALVEPDLFMLKNICTLARPGASFMMLINLSVFENLEYCRKLKLPPLDLERARTELASLYQDTGIQVKQIKVLDKEFPHKTTWGQKLICGSNRKILMIDAIICSQNNGSRR